MASLNVNSVNGILEKNRFAFRLRMSKFNGKWVTLVIAGDSVHIYPSSNFIFFLPLFLGFSVKWI